MQCEAERVRKRKRGKNIEERIVCEQMNDGVIKCKYSGEAERERRKRVMLDQLLRLWCANYDFSANLYTDL